MLEREHCRQEVDKARREMAESYQAKFEALVERERRATEQLQRQQEISDREMFTQRQNILEEIEALKQRDLQLRRQQETESREKSLWDEKLKAREELAKQREETARRLEVEYEHRIRDEVEKFRLEERTRYVDRLTSVEFREARVKETEQRLEEQLQDVSGVKVELKDKRIKVNELESELIRTRHELLAAQKQVDSLTEKAREMVDYQMLKEDNSVLRRELEGMKTRVAELMRDNLVERQKQEELLREMGQQAAKPTPEVGLLRQQIEQLHSRHRTELALVQHEKLQLQQRLQAEIECNKELAMKCDEQTWQQKQIGLEASDLRERLLDSHYALIGQGFQRHGDLLNGSGFLDNFSDVVQQGGEVDHDRYRDVGGDSQRAPAAEARRAGTPDDFSYSSDVVQDTKNRLRQLESEAENLEKNYRDFQFRVTHLDPVLEPEKHQREMARVTRQMRKELTSSLERVSHIDVQSTRQTESQMYGQEKSTVTASAHRQKEPASSHDRVSHIDVQSTRQQPDKVELLSASKARVPQHDLAIHSSVRTTHTELVAERSHAQPVDCSRYSEAQQTQSVIPSATSDVQHDAYSHRIPSMYDKLPQAIATHSDSIDGAGQVNSHLSIDAHTGDGEQPEREHTVSRHDSGSRHNGDSSSDVVLTSSNSQQPPSTADSLSSHHQLPAASDFGTVSLDDAWKTLSTSVVLATNERLEDEQAEREQLELQRKQREEERQRLDEEAREREQQALRQLQRQEQHLAAAKSSDAEEQPLAGAVTTEAEGAAGDAEPATLEPKLDPELEKYMAIVRSREKEKQEASPPQSVDDLSVDADEASESRQTSEKEDFW